MNKYIIASKLFQENYKFDIVDLKFVRSIKELQSFSFSKIFITIKYGYLIFKKLTTSKPDFVYFTICPTGLAFYRDMFYILILKVSKSKLVFHLHGKGVRKNAEKNVVLKKIISVSLIIQVLSAYRIYLPDMFLMFMMVYHSLFQMELSYRQNLVIPGLILMGQRP